MRHPNVVITGAVFLLSSLVCFVLLVRLPVIYDADSYYHLAAARLYAEQGVVDSLPWARFSLLQDRFADKELLFHLLLIPFVRGFEPTVGGRLFLALLNGGIYTAIARSAMRVWRWQGALVPAWIWIAAIPFASRANRLRPELCALILLFAAITCVARGRSRWLGLVTFVFTLTYTAFHALLGLCVLWCLERFWRTRRFEPGLILWPTVGAAFGLILHFHFPQNLYFWSVQNVHFFLGAGDLDVGDEILPRGAEQLVYQQLGWWIGLVVLFLATIRDKRSGRSVDEQRRGAGGRVDRFAATAVAAGVFGVLFVMMGRFGFYFVPLASLALLEAIPIAGRRGSVFVRLPVGRINTVAVAPLLLGLALAIVPGLGRVRSTWGELFRDLWPVPYETDRRQWASHVPAGARVAAHWGDAEFYVFYAPEARYLNLLDPVFMAVPYPEIYDIQRAVYEDREPDVPLQMVSSLESDWIAFWRTPRPGLLARLKADPRAELHYAGRHVLARVRPERNDDFFLDWTVEPPLDSRRRISATPSPYPRIDPTLGPSAPGLPLPAAVEGFVNVARLPASLRSHPCLLFRSETLLAPPGREDPWRVRLELAAAGPSKLVLDGREIVTSPGSRAAALGRGEVVDIELSSDESAALAVITCRGADGTHGFYLLRRPVP